MARFNEINDVYFTDIGDFVLSSSGDLEDTKLHSYRGLVQRIFTRIMSKQGEWALERSIGANLSSFVGKPNTEAIGAQIKQRLINELLQENLLAPQEFIVDVIPTGNNQISIVLFISPPRSTEQITLAFSYDMRDNRLIPRNI